jgi:predicted nucleotide-binding protein
MEGHSQDLLAITERLEKVWGRSDKREIEEPLQKLQDASSDVGRAWSGSFLGYHSRVYYRGLWPVPPGARFSPQWGLSATAHVTDTAGDWVEFGEGEVIEATHIRAGNPDLEPARRYAGVARKAFENDRAKVVSLLCLSLEGRDDPLVEGFAEEARAIECFSATEYRRESLPCGSPASWDSVAVAQGPRVPPHIIVRAEILSTRRPAEACRELSKVARRAASHLSGRENRARPKVGSNVFVGHDHFPVCKALRDFVRGELGLPCVEFDRTSAEGGTSTERLSGLLDEAAIAFSIVTADDERAGEEFHAWTSTIYEAGFAQGRLGLTRAFVLLEDGCEPPSKARGLRWIRFPKGNVEAAFEEIRRVLKCEGLIKSEQSDARAPESK